ncbi:MAG: carboxylating nicotinate-nucleotide diphosphorylase [Phycisphaerales bacterium]
MSISNQDQSIHEQNESIAANSLDQFASKLRESGLIQRLIQLAHDEDLAPEPGSAPHDWTGELMFTQDQSATAQLVLRQTGTIAGLAFVPDILKVFVQADEQMVWTPSVHDGVRSSQGTVLGTLAGSSIALVRIERTLLNLIARLSGIATTTREYVDLIAGNSVDICDTRKTTPGLRAFEKYAVRCGGGVSHRMGLYDALLVKDNHLAGLGQSAFQERVRGAAIKARKNSLSFVQVEVDTLVQLEWLLAMEPGTCDLVLLDNMPPETLLAAVQMRTQANPSLKLEASGGVSAGSVVAIAETGVDRISIGALTHQAVSLDIGLDTP